MMIDSRDQLSFRDRIYPIAIPIEEALGIKKEFLATQSAHESTWGTSGLSVQDNNLFGMTANESWINGGLPFASWPSRECSKHPPDKIRYWNKPGDIIDKVNDGKGGSVLTVRVDFCRYDSWEASAKHWADHLSTFPIYKSAFAFSKAIDPGQFFDAIAAAGYASDPRYAADLRGVYGTLINLPPFSDGKKSI